MGQVVVGMDAGFGRELAVEEAELVTTLSEILPEHEVLRSEVFRREREAEAALLRKRLPEMSRADRAKAVEQFAVRHPFGDDRFNLEQTLKALTLREDADALLSRLPELSAAERITVVTEFRRACGPNSKKFDELHRKLEVLDPATAEAVPPDVILYSLAPPPEVLTIVISAISGQSQNKLSISLSHGYARGRTARTVQRTSTSMAPREKSFDR